MNNNEGNIVVPTEAVTVTIHEYKRGIIARTLLEGILNYREVESSYRLAEYVDVARAIYKAATAVSTTDTESEQDA